MRNYVIESWEKGGMLRYILTFIFIYFCFFLVYTIVKRVLFNKKRGLDGLEEYQDTMTIYFNAKEELQSVLKEHLFFQIIFLIGFLLIRYSLSTSYNIEESTKDSMFIIGVVCCSFCLLVYFVKYIIAGGFGSIESIWKEATIKYAPPEYVTEVKYEQWDDEPNPREIYRITYNKNGERNAIAFVTNIIGYILKIFSFVALATLYFLEKCYDTLKAVYTYFARPLVKNMAKTQYYNYVIKKTQKDGFVYKTIYSEDFDEYNEIPREIANNMLKKSYESLKSNSSNVFVFAHFGENAYFTSYAKRKHEIPTIDGKGSMILLESQENRFFIAVREPEDIFDMQKFIAVPIPYRNVYRFYPIEDEDVDAIQNLSEMMITTQFLFLKEMKFEMKETAKVQIMSLSNGIFTPIEAQLKDITINEDERTYTVEKHKPAKNVSAKPNNLNHLLVFFILTLLFVVIVPEIIWLAQSYLQSSGSSQIIMPPNFNIKYILLSLPLIYFIIFIIRKNKN